MAPANAPALTPPELLLDEAPSWETHLKELQVLQSLEKPENVSSWYYSKNVRKKNLLIWTHCRLAAQLQGGGGPQTTQDWDCLGQRPLSWMGMADRSSKRNVEWFLANQRTEYRSEKGRDRAGAEGDGEGVRGDGSHGRMVDIARLSFAHPGSDLNYPALRDVSFAVPRGSRTVIVGANGGQICSLLRRFR